jgi:exopolyphosphatase/guanosine-5'-triphosphate,3'-diphosphate pyrophosphatase
VVRLHEELVRHDPMRRGDIRRLRERVLQLLEPQLPTLLESRPKYAIAAGGTVRALARLVAEGRSARRASALNSVVLDRETLGQLADELARSNHRERMNLRGMRRNRVDLLPTGAVILEAVADALRVKSIRVCDWGLREGILLGSFDD